jgi:hypothetical protein
MPALPFLMMALILLTDTNRLTKLIKDLLRRYA